MGALEDLYSLLDWVTIIYSLLDWVKIIVVASIRTRACKAHYTESLLKQSFSHCTATIQLVVLSAKVMVSSSSKVIW